MVINSFLEEQFNNKFEKNLETSDADCVSAAPNELNEDSSPENSYLLQ